MNLDFDQEVDQLLRHHAERDVRASADASEHAAAQEISGQMAASTEVPAAHLDADELSAYVEDAVPAATRAHYMAHLAECERCRRIATSVALVANAETEPKPHSATLITPPTPSWINRFAGMVATLFAPRTLKFALPMLLAVCGGVLGVLFLATHNRQNDSLVAGRSGEVEIRPAVFSNTNSSIVPTAEMSPSASTDQANIAATSDASSDASRAATSAHPSPERKMNEAAAPERLAANRGATSSPASTPAGTASSTNLEATASSPALAPAPIPAPASGISEARVQRPSVAASDRETTRITEAPLANQTSGGAASKDSSTVEEKQAANDKRREDAENLSLLGRSAAPPLTMTPRQSSVGQNSAGQNSPAEPARTKMKRLPDPAAKQTANQKAESAAVVPVEVRRIGGRQFRRQPNQPRGQWIDSSYNSSITTISVTRGSEQFRALVADEPELGRIIEQLNGEIIVVWKKRAYHIR